MSQTVRYDAAALQGAMEERAGQYETFRGQLMVLKDKMTAVTNLGEAFEGKAANSIKSFFKAQSTIVDMWIQLVDQQILFMNDVGAMAEDRKLGGSTYVDVPFLEEELETAHVRTMEMIQKQHKDLAGVLAEVNDLVAIEAYSTAEMEASLEDAKNKRNDTIETLEEYDHALVSEYNQSMESQELVDSLLDSLIQSTSQNGVITTVSFNAHAFENSEAFKSIEGARGRSLAYINQKQEQQKLREANASAAALNFSEVNGMQTAYSGANSGIMTPEFMASNHGPLFNMMNPNRLDQMISAAYLPVTSSTPKTHAEKQLEDLLAQKGIQNEPITEEELAGLRAYLSDPATIESFSSSNPGDAVERDYPDPTYADMRKVLGNPNSDVGMEAGGHYVVGGIKFLFEDIATLLNPDSTPSEVTMAAMFTFFKPLKAADKGYDLAGAGKKVEDAGDVRKGSEVDSTNRTDKVVNTGTDTVFNSYKYWDRTIEFKNVKVYQRNDIIDPNLKDARGRTNADRMKKGLAPLGPDGKSINLHHTTQRNESSIAEVTSTFHKENSNIIHINPNTIPSGINRKEFNKWRSDYWKERDLDF
ncbi:hypothetical protein E2R51_09175 [Jeotgalibacillus sp. S-D1]|uniref:T7SS effector LXG polymorphic toxin n=1 Tax=Jeotgalibacillus sp. S-D1 TaxID=2552189 RepID=UPI001059B5FF|nr:T7SS effector LXG polymorphic toxin [Jeotgalibacillus sp. S-D1]TDL32832.1 hypothetical protein E2R51_09175 [Jeotgalibacillus sp. S-D1]